MTAQVQQKIAEGGPAKTGMMMKLQGLTFFGSKRRLSEAIPAPLWTFRRQPHYRSCRTHCPAASRFLLPAV